MEARKKAGREMKQAHITNTVEDLQKIIDDARKYQQLKHQYGIASQKIYELKCENALLREKLNGREDDPVVTISEPRVFKVGDPDPAELGLVVRSSQPLAPADTDTFLLEYTYFKPTDSVEWNLVDGYSWSHWHYWVEHYGPLTEVL